MSLLYLLRIAACKFDAGFTRSDSGASPTRNKHSTRHRARSKIESPKVAELIKCCWVTNAPIYIVVVQMPVSTFKLQQQKQYVRLYVANRRKPRP